MGISKGFRLSDVLSLRHGCRAENRQNNEFCVLFTISESV